MEITEENITDLIADALAIVGNPELWTQEAAARDEYSGEVCPTHPIAKMFSVRGAIAFALYCKQMDCSIGGHNVRAVSRELSKGLGIGCEIKTATRKEFFDMLDSWNDDTDHATIIVAMRHVIKARGGNVPI